MMGHPPLTTHRQVGGPKPTEKCGTRGKRSLFFAFPVGAALPASEIGA